MRVELLIIAALELGAIPAFGQTGAGNDPWLVRICGSDMLPANTSGAFTALGTTFSANLVHLSTKIVPKVDFSYFFTRNIAAELVLTYPKPTT